MLHLAKVQKNFGSERTVNFPARKLGNFLWPVKIFEKRRETSEQMIIVKQILTQKSGRTNFFYLENWQMKKAIKTLIK